MRLGLRLLLVSLLCWPLFAKAADIEFKKVVLYLAEAVVYLDAFEQINLNETILEALESGVPLTFETHIQVRRDGAWIWETDLVEARLRQILRFHPLSATYELYDPEGGTQQSFSTREAALAALGEMREVPLVEHQRLDPDQSYRVKLKTRLDIAALPLPLRPQAYVSPAWHFRSDSWEWQLEP